MKNLFLFFYFILLALAKVSIGTINRNLEDLKESCKGEKNEFCQTKNLKIAAAFLHNQFAQIKTNMERALKEARKEEIARKRSRKKDEQFLLKLRQHFLDRHL
jgi:hypothetical protein